MAICFEVASQTSALFTLGYVEIVSDWTLDALEIFAVPFAFDARACLNVENWRFLVKTHIISIHIQVLDHEFDQ